MKQYSDAVLELATFLKNHPDIDDKLTSRWDYPSASIWLSDGDTAEFGRLCRALGDFQKSGYNGQLTARYAPEDEEGDRIFSLSVNVSGACERTPKVDENGNVVTRTVTRTVPVETKEVEEEEVEYEYNCPDSFLAL